MKYKLVAIDCDNTLLNSQGHIPEENKKTIQYLKAKGIEFVIATGRNDILVADYIDELDIKAPIIGCNGASIRNLNENKLLSFNPIPEKSLKLIFNYCDKNNIPFRAFTLEKGFSNDKNSVNEVVNRILASYTKILKKNLVYEFSDNSDYLAENEKIIKVVIVHDDPEYIKKYQSEVKSIGNIDVYRSARNCIDIMSSGVSKGNALKKYAEILNIKPEETIAFGDSENDLSMIEYAGLGIAMENAEEILKKYADFTTSSNNDCGVANALKKVFSDLF